MDVSASERHPFFQGFDQRHHRGLSRRGHDTTAICGRWNGPVRSDRGLDPTGS
jgi:hypothetical protein